MSFQLEASAVVLWGAIQPIHETTFIMLQLKVAMSLKTIVKAQESLHSAPYETMLFIIHVGLLLRSQLVITWQLAQSPNHAADPSEPSSGLILKRLGARMEAGLSLEQHHGLSAAF